MLQTIRDRAQGVFAWIIVGMISIPFALWGINSYFGGGSDDAIAEVEGVKISPRQVQAAYQQQRDRLAQMFGGKIPENLFSEEVMKRQILQQLIEKEVLIQAAVDNGMRIGDPQLASIVRGIDAFYVDGKFNYEEYERVLARQGMSPRMFEQRVRRDLLAGQLTGAVLDTEFSLDSEIDAQLRLLLQQRDSGYMILPLDKYEATIALTADEVQGYYETNAARFMRPEQVKIDYLELKAADMAMDIDVSEEELRQRYEAQKLNFRTAEERRASHILIAVPVGSDEAEAKGQAEALLARIQAGEDFATLAKAESQDPGSARNGGDLGFFGMGVMDKAFEEAAFALQQGEVSPVVRSAFGFHIIKLEAIKGGETKPYSEVAAALKRKMQNELAAEAFYDKAEQLASLTYEQPDTLAVAAERLQLAVKSSDYFSRAGGAGVAAQQKVVQAAFSEDVLARGNNSETIELADNHLVVVRINDHRPEALRPLEEVQAAIEASLKREKAQQMAQQEAAALLAKMQAGDKPETLAAASKLEWKRQAGLQRDAGNLEPAIVQEVFRMPQPVKGGVSLKQLTLPGGNQALIALYGTSDGDVAAAAGKLSREVAQRLQRASADAAELSLIAGLRERAEISIQQ